MLATNAWSWLANSENNSSELFSRHFWHSLKRISSRGPAVPDQLLEEFRSDCSIDAAVVKARCPLRGDRLFDIGATFKGFDNWGGEGAAAF
jgi:hypothetical protein